jgi:hypothetical protein
MTYKITESDAIEGTTVERDATAQEIADIKSREQKSQDITDAEKSIEENKISAIAKLAALGLNADEVNAFIR